MEQYYLAGTFAVVYRLDEKQFLLLLTRHLFDGAFSFHGGKAIWLFFDIDQLHRQPHPCIFGAASLVVDVYAFVRVDRPTCVVCPIGTFDNITVASWHVVEIQPGFLFARLAAIGEQGTKHSITK